jgi:hypothetical protein
MSTSGGGTVPLWWRQIPADYHLPLFQGKVLLPLPAVERPLLPLGSEHTDLGSFRQAVEDFLSHPAQHEIRLWRRLAEKYLRKDPNEEVLAEIWEKNAAERRKRDPAWTAENPFRTEPSIATRLEFLEKMTEWSSPVQFITNLLAMAPIDSGNVRFPGWSLLEQACSREMLDMLESESYRDRVPTHVLDSIRRRLTPPNPSDDSSESPSYRSPFQALVEDDPGAAVEYLLNWTNRATQWHEKNLPYEYGSFFCWRCPTNRAAYLRQLLDAREPFVRVAAAVYLCFEDKELGMRKLKEFSALDGDPGGFAALNLARRGDKDAVPRALRLLENDGDPQMVGVPHRNLQKRLLVLLSNSAKASGLPPLPIPPGASYEPRNSRQVLEEWWKEYRDRVILTDPWLPVWEAQKVD